jgi:hypothetical protein
LSGKKALEYLDVEKIKIKNHSSQILPGVRTQCIQPSQGLLHVEGAGAL